MWLSPFLSSRRTQDAFQSKKKFVKLIVYVSALNEEWRGNLTAYLLKPLDRQRKPSETTVIHLLLLKV